MRYTKPNVIYYRIAQIASWFVAFFIFKRKILRNEIKGIHGPYVVIANHQAALDFVNLIGMTYRPMTFVISNSFYQTLPITGFLKKMGVIPKQQFQTSINDMRNMKAVIDQGQPLVIYPTGLMSEDGLSTPIPQATYKFLKWLKADIYIARTVGAYFVMPKWGSGIRPGRTYIDVYKLFSKEELAQLDVQTIKARTDDAILFDAYREQEKRMVPYKGSGNIAGLEHVLYMCPHCKSEFSIRVKEKNTIFCTKCGFEQISDQYGFLSKQNGIGNEIRYVSDWSRLIYEDLKQQIEAGSEIGLSSVAEIHMIDSGKHKFINAGSGTVTLSREGFQIAGTIHGDIVDLFVPIANIPTLPFSPGKYLEVQHGEDIYRCIPADGRLVMKYINLVKIFHERSAAAVIK